MFLNSNADNYSERLSRSSKNVSYKVLIKTDTRRDEAMINYINEKHFDLNIGFEQRLQPDVRCFRSERKKNFKFVFSIYL